MHPTDIDVTAAIRDHAKACDLSVTALFRRAGVAPSNWWRWRHTDRQPTMRTLRKLLDVEALPHE